MDDDDTVALAPHVFHLRISNFQLNMEGQVGASYYNSSITSLCDSEAMEVHTTDNSGDEPPPSRMPSLRPSTSLSADQGVAQVAVMFPLPSETCLENSLLIKQLDSAFYPGLQTAQKGVASSSNNGFATNDWEVAQSKGIKVEAAISLPAAEGTLHTIMKFMNSKGTALAEGVIAVPR